MSEIKAGSLPSDCRAHMRQCGRCISLLITLILQTRGRSCILLLPVGDDDRILSAEEGAV